MMRLALSLLPLLQAPQEDVTRATLVFETMHCDECRAELEAVLRKLRGFKSSATAENRVTVTIEDRVPLPAFDRLPRDLTLKQVLVEIAGTVSFAEDKAALVAKGSGAVLALVNPEKPKPMDRLAELRKKLGGKNRFRVRGTLAGTKTIVLDSFEPADWKDTPD